MGLFGGNRDPLFGERLRAALAIAGGDENAASQFQARQAQQAALRLRQEEAAREAEARSNQVWGLKESGFGNPLIAAMSGQDASQAARQRIEPYSQAAGTTRVTPSLTGGEDQRTTAPINEEQIGAWLDTQDPTGNLRQTYARRQAFPPTSIPEGGGLAGMGANGPEWLVPPASIGSPAPATAPTRGPPPSAPRIGQTRPSGPYSGPDPLSIMRAIPGATFNSGRRTPEGNAAVGGVQNSNHLRGDSIDIGVGTSGLSLGQLAQRARQHYGPSARVTPEPQRNHVHIDFPGNGSVPFHGARGARGAPQRAAGGSGNLPRVNSPAQAARLPRGSQFITPDGTIRRVP